MGEGLRPDPGADLNAAPQPPYWDDACKHLAKRDRVMELLHQVGLRDEHEAILPGYHMNKKHWNTVVLDGSLPPPLVRDMIRESYDLVVAGLPKKQRQSLPAR